MKTIQKIIEAHGGFEAVTKDYVRIENEPFMRLVIEVLDHQTDNQWTISVAHYHFQNGDAMRDPEITFLVTTSGESWGWEPLSFQQDNLGLYQEVLDEEGKENARLQWELKQFAAMWDRNIRGQGFLDAYRESRTKKENE